jgi:inward rectifier potassium channel
MDARQFLFLLRIACCAKLIAAWPTKPDASVIATASFGLSRAGETRNRIGRSGILRRMASKTQDKVVPLIAGRSRRIAEQQNPSGVFTDFYLYLLSSSWPLLLLQIAATFFFANALFAIGYYSNGGIENAHSFGDAYFFSVETMATIGYGKLVPVSLFANLLMSVEALTGMLGIALVTGLIFAKFSRPTARVRFSFYAVISPRDGVPSLMFRMANVRANQIVEAQIHLVLTRLETTTEGEEVRRFYDLELTRNHNPIFAYSWTAVHPILPGSPLFGATPETLARSNAWMLVSLTGLDETFSQTVHARMYYGNEDILWGARLTDILVRVPDGSFVMDFAKFDSVEPAPLPAWDPAAQKAFAES